ncbi:hypothetical protein CBM2623_A40052 [Cupriavidus taiwanensis]|nr:hypothetical protein CBM2608_A30052 [Cupriavidus taiwanensis]SPA29511.1 hypothetical protein CBM2623_A40052 [Cupriavidus taiwanensis]
MIASRTGDALFGYFLALGQKVTRPAGRNPAVQTPTACHQHRPPTTDKHPAPSNQKSKNPTNPYKPAGHTEVQTPEVPLTTQPPHAAQLPCP